MPLSRRRLLALAAGAPALTLAGADRPKRNMIALSTRPEDYEMPLDGFLEEITPVDRFFVRSHHYTPDVDLKDWALEVTGSVEKPLKLSLDELKKMPRAELTALEAWLAAGGRLLVLNASEREDERRLLNHLTAPFGIRFGDGCTCRLPGGGWCASRRRRWPGPSLGHRPAAAAPSGRWRSRASSSRRRP